MTEVRYITIAEMNSTVGLEMGGKSKYCRLREEQEQRFYAGQNEEFEKP